MIEPALFEVRRDGFLLSTDRARLDVDTIHRFLAEQSYWAAGLARDRLERALAGSLPIGIYADDQTMAAFGRLVTDCAMFAYLRDVFTLPEHRGRGLATWMAREIRNHPDLSMVGNWMLATRDAHAVYAKAGFRPVPHPEFYMSLRRAPGEPPAADTKDAPQ